MKITRTLKVFLKKHLGEYDNLHVQSDILLLADVFENFQNMSLEIYELDLARLLTARGLAWQATLKRPEKRQREM